MTVRETRNDAKSENEIVNVSGMKSSFAWPSRNTVGRNTTMVVMVETKIGIATSRAASRTARAAVLAGDRQVPVDVLQLDDRVVDEAPDARARGRRA